ncbi:hypothetical protein QFZ79_002887 [Arthrobacter sp. V4I6]|uniref:hypothetical protein n=1 Tax=Arthrobacter sp. V4I6 TaxID=3042281 RepID=UPI00278533AD|nr:hypothetical protein [Arthrobacter sp. V4I6]MDQ0854776.1 hypothetical protein [Arthrobacter sp. V4I6]
MQTITGYPTDLDVTMPSSLVTVNGVPVDDASVSVTRELSSSLPAQVSAASGITAATGTVDWAVGEDVQTRPAHPWDGNEFPPKPADEVVVYMGYGEALVRQLTGIVDSSSGSVADGSVSSDLVDRIDKLNQPVTFPAHLSVFPPLNEGGPSLPVGNEPTFTTDRILRACGFNATPPITSGCILSVPFMGSAWPERGTVTASGQTGLPQYPPSHTTTQWGVGTNSCDATYTPDLGGAGGNGKLDRSLQITAKARNIAGTTGSSYMRVYWGTEYLQLVVTADRRIFAQINKGTTVSICSMTAAAAATADVFTLRVSPAGATTIFANNGATVTGTAALSTGMTTTNMTSARVIVPHLTGVTVGGVQVNFGDTSVYNSAQTAALTPAAYSFSMPAFPRIVGRTALDLLKEQAEAECASMWIDEHGVFRWVNRDELTTADPAATLTALDDVLDIGWESDSSGVRSKVVLTSRDPAVRRSSVANQFCWQASGVSMEAGQVDVQLASPPADTDWVDLDDDGNLVSNTGDWLARFNLGRGSWMGGVETTDTDERWAVINNPAFAATIEHVGNQTYKITTTAGTPSAGYTVELRTPTKAYSPGLRSSKEKFNLPILRSKAVVEWKDLTITGAMLGPTDAAALEHNVGPWVQDPDGLQDLADWLAVQVAEPVPILRDLNVIPDFRRQLGDVVWIEDPETLRIRLRVLITRISTSVGPGTADQSVAGRILEVQSYGPTNDQLDVHAGGYTNTSFDTLWADATNTTLDAAPLERG